MLKYSLFIVLLITVASGDVTNNSSIIIQKENTHPANSTQQAKQEISTKSSVNDNKTNSINEEKNIGKGEVTQLNSLTNNSEPVGDLDDTINFKYYWVLLVFSSLTIISLIVFKSFRLRRTRAEIKYGKPKEADEIEPLGRRSKWDDVDSSENEDEIFDINFLKNTRLNPPNDV